MRREIGRFHQLRVLDVNPHSIVLDGEQWGSLPLARDQCSADLAVGDQVEVFVMPSATGQPVATTLRPHAEAGQVAWLKVVDVTQVGAFVDWGLPKDLFIPFAEQPFRLRPGVHALVRVYIDNQGRLAGSTRIDHWIKDHAEGLGQGDKVSLMIAEKTELGFKAIVNHTYWGLLYSNELYQRVRKGQQLDGYIQRIRDDGKIDLALTRPGFSKGKLDDIGDRILEALKNNDGFLALTDKSPPREIYAAFGVSKKQFKQALGGLYKQRVIALEVGGIRLL